MSLGPLLAGLRQISLNGPAGSLIRNAACTSLLKPLAQTTSQSFIPRCLLHSSPACLRIHDNRLRIKEKVPSSMTNKWELRPKFSDVYEYTVRPLPFPRTGGRGPNGRIWNHKRAGGHKRRFRMIDWQRAKLEQREDLLEKVDKILYDPNRSARIALVAGGETKRYIIATANMKEGDIIRSSAKLSKTAVRASEGDAYPVGSLPIGSIVNCIEKFPGDGAYFARSAGVTAQLVRKGDEQCVLRLPSKREIIVSPLCQAVLGRVSNVDHNKRVIGKAGRNRWLGFRPNSGRWHRKDGRFGRKIRPLKPPRVYSVKVKPSAPVYKMTLS